MTNPMTTTGDTIYSSSGSTPARLGIGSTGNVLTVAGGVPTWAAPAGGGKVLQVVTATTTSTVTVTSTTFTDSNLTATITPTLSTSKVLVLISQPCDIFRTSTGTSMGGGYKLLRGATDIYTYGTDAALYMQGASADLALQVTMPVSYLDSPATTSATTYKTQIRSEGGANTRIRAQPSPTVSSIVLLEIGA
jgi:hypothetical protein